MDPELGPEGAAVDAALGAWRRDAADILMAAVAAVLLPAVILAIIGHSPPMGVVVKSAGLGCYAGGAAAALLRRFPYRLRLWVFFFTGYFFLAVANIALPRGPYAQVGLVGLPLMVLVISGTAGARVATAGSAIILTTATFVRNLPGVAQALAIDPMQLAGPPGLVWMQVTITAGFLIVLMLLVHRFHRFLLDALAAQCRATTQLQRESAERAAAQREMEKEMRERQRLQREIAGIGDSERRRLAHELHDGICQQITAAMLRCQALERRLQRGGALSDTDFSALSRLLAESIGEARNVAMGLCPLDPDPEALAPALRALTKRIQDVSAVQCEFLATGDVRVSDPSLAQNLYRIAQEALSNAVRHAQASRITVELHGDAGGFRLRVEDNGKGMPGKVPADGMGLRTMAYRAQILEGELTVGPAGTGGTSVACRVPRLPASPTAPCEAGGRGWSATM